MSDNICRCCDLEVSLGLHEGYCFECSEHVDSLKSKLAEVTALLERSERALDWYANPCGPCAEMYSTSCHGGIVPALKALAEIRSAKGDKT